LAETDLGWSPKQLTNWDMILKKIFMAVMNSLGDGHEYKQQFLSTIERPDTPPQVLCTGSDFSKGR